LSTVVADRGSSDEGSTSRQSRQTAARKTLDSKKLSTISGKADKAGKKSGAYPVSLLEII